MSKRPYSAVERDTHPQDGFGDVDTSLEEIIVENGFSLPANLTLFMDQDMLQPKREVVDFSWQENFVRLFFKPMHVNTVLAILKDPKVRPTREAFTVAAHARGLDATWYLKRPNRFQFDAAKHLSGASLQKRVRHLANLEPQYVQVFSSIQPGANLFGLLWPGIDIEAVAPTLETRMALGSVALLAHLSLVSPHVRAVLDHAPDRPNYEFHMVNALMGTIKFLVKPEAKDPEATTILMHKTLLLLVHLTTQVPDIGKPGPTAPFPALASFLTSFVDRMACTPRLRVDMGCEDEPQYRVMGHFLDALQVDADETCTLDRILHEFEEELVHDDDIPPTCHLGHPLVVHEYYYHYEQGPPPLLFFEAKSPRGIPRQCITPTVHLSEYIQGEQREYTYACVAVVSVSEDDMILELYWPEEPEGSVEPQEAPIAMVVYVRDNVRLTDDVDVVAESSEEDENENISMEDSDV